MQGTAERLKSTTPLGQADPDARPACSEQSRGDQSGQIHVCIASCYEWHQGTFRRKKNFVVLTLPTEWAECRRNDGCVGRVKDDRLIGGRKFILRLVTVAALTVREFTDVHVPSDAATA